MKDSLDSSNKANSNCFITLKKCVPCISHEKIPHDCEEVPACIKEVQCTVEYHKDVGGLTFILYNK